MTVANTIENCPKPHNESRSDQQIRKIGASPIGYIYTSPPSQPTTTRKQIAGAQGWAVNSLGVVYRNTRRVEPIFYGGHLAIDFKGTYRGLLIPAGTGPLVRDEYDDDETDPSCLRLLAEIVCLTFHGPPPFNAGLPWPHNFWLAKAYHFDGDHWNCHADNVMWKRDDDELAAMHDREVRGWMDSHKRAHGGSTKEQRNKKSNASTNFVGADCLPGWLPVGPLPKKQQRGQQCAKFTAAPCAGI